MLGVWETKNPATAGFDDCELRHIVQMIVDIVTLVNIIIGEEWVGID